MASTPGRPILASAPGRRSSVPAAPRQLLSTAGTGSAPSEGGCHLTNGCQVPQRCAAGNRRWRSRPEGGRVDADRVHGGRSKVHRAAGSGSVAETPGIPATAATCPAAMVAGARIRTSGRASRASGGSGIAVRAGTAAVRPPRKLVDHHEAAPLRVTPLRAGGQLLCGRRHRRRGVRSPGGVPATAVAVSVVAALEADNTIELTRRVHLLRDVTLTLFDARRHAPAHQAQRAHSVATFWPSSSTTQPSAGSSARDGASATARRRLLLVFETMSACCLGCSLPHCRCRP